MKRTIDILTGAVAGAGLVILSLLLTRSCAAAGLGIGVTWDGRSLAATARLSGDFAEWGIQIGDGVRSHLIFLGGHRENGGLEAGLGVILGEWRPMMIGRVIRGDGYLAIESDGTSIWGAAVYRPIEDYRNVSTSQNIDRPERKECPPPHDHPPPCI